VKTSTDFSVSSVETNSVVIDRLRSLRGPGEAFSDVILRPASENVV
jgi:hypothetical protein